MRRGTVIDSGMQDLNALYQKNIAYSRFCEVCGRRIKAADSVTRGIGPKCLKKLRQTEIPRQTELFDGIPVIFDITGERALERSLR